MFELLSFLFLLFINVSAYSSEWMGGGKCPWGDKDVQNAHPQHDLPHTGETRQYELHVARATMAPDGVSKNMLVVNGQYPGPTIEANWGDWIEVNVFNDIYGPEESTTIHWHGLNQPGTPWFDGVPAASQCPIIPGTNFTYRFLADEYGTSWYHSHLPGQYSAGVIGPIVIHGPISATYDVDLGTVMIGEWYHEYYKDSLAKLLGPGQNPNAPPPLPAAKSNLVNGKGRYPCADVTNGAACTVNPYASWNVEPNKKYLMRLINSGASAFETVSIDNHTFTVVANDFIPVEPYETNFVTLGVAQRTDVVFTTNGDPGQSYWLRAWNGPFLCADTLAPNDTVGADGRGIIAYTGSDVSVEPTSIGLPLPSNPLCSNDDLTLTKPAFAMPAVSEPDVIFTFDITAGATPNGALRIYMNNITFVGDTSAPLLLSPNIASPNPQSYFPPERQLYNAGNGNAIVRVILNNGFIASHPFHLHGHDFQVLSVGHGYWDGTIINAENPNRRDTQMLWGGANITDPTVGVTHLVLQYEADNAGVWPLHCHNAWHLSAGMMVMVTEKQDELAYLLNNFLPPSVKNTCGLWSTWSGSGKGNGTSGGA